ncbi:MAG TPA: SprB repeat-containing protein, partial [Bacteroidia bacterium]|nr:SprB repeat-containing protein [Bacteroidia bacterium]
MKTKALLAGIGSLFVCLNTSATIKESNVHAGSAGCPTITVTITKQTTVSCNGGNNGSAIVSASGGATPYTYNWTPSGGTKDTASNLTAGNYTVTVTDKNGCTGTKKVIIVQPAVLKDFPGIVNVKCFGGATGVSTAAPLGGTPPYKYSWSTGSTNVSINNLVAGAYTITVTDKNSCVNTTTVTITQPATAVTATVTTTPESCNAGSNGSATATASGGTPSYTYKWNNTATTQTINNVTSATYTCTVKDANGCNVMASAKVAQPAAITFSKTFTYPACNASTGSIAVTVSGGTTAYTYSWLPSGGTNATASGLSAGSYTLNVTDGNGCPASVNSLLYNSGIIASTVVTNVTCFGSANGSITTSIAGAMAPYTYSWAPS